MVEMNGRQQEKKPTRSTGIRFFTNNQYELFELFFELSKYIIYFNSVYHTNTKPYPGYKNI